MTRPATGGSLVSHHANPFHQIVFEQAAHRHHHQTYGAIATNVIALSRYQGIVDNRAVYRVENDNAVIVHAQGGRRIDPVTCPAHAAQLAMHLFAIVSALTADDCIHRTQLLQIVSVLQ